jgi:hypothetical protein
MKEAFVYCHARLDTDAVFYVGKGTKRRVNERRGRSAYWNNIVNKAGGFRSIVLAENLEETAALDLERDLIQKMRLCGYRLCNITDGGEGVSGYKHSPELKNYLQQKSIGNKSRTGQKATAQERQKISLAQIGKIHSEQTKKKMGLRVFCETNGQMYDTQTEAANSLGISSTLISSCCRGKISQTHGYVFRYADETRNRKPYTKKQKDSHHDRLLPSIP